MIYRDCAVIRVLCWTPYVGPPPVLTDSGVSKLNNSSLVVTKRLVFKAEYRV